MPHLHIWGSIAYGVIAGVLSYITLNGIPFIITKLSGGRIVPHEVDKAEPWVIPPGGIVPPWVYVLSPLSHIAIQWPLT